MISALQHANIIAILAVKSIKGCTKIVVSERNMVQINGWRSGLFALLIFLLYRMSDQVVAVSEGVSKQLSSLLVLKKTKVIYNPIINNEMLLKSKMSVDDQWFNDYSSPLVVTIGRLVEQKNFSELLRAVSHVKSHMNIRLIVFGAGPLRSELVALTEDLEISRLVRFYGLTDNPFAWLARADLFVSSSRWEGLPGVVGQAAALSKYVISSDCAEGAAEILLKVDNYALYSCGDLKSLINAIRVWYSEIYQNDIYGSEEFENISILERFFGQEVINQQYIDLIKGVVNDD